MMMVIVLLMKVNYMLRIEMKQNINILLKNVKNLKGLEAFIQSRCNRGCLVSSDVFRRDFFDTT